ncbi:MAG: hypothetical protein GWN58_28330 [Anaerolineae bacterium]|nr:hypothetical protein [Anaerolineae bacterium]
MYRQRTKVPCSFTTKAGRPCRAWAVRGSDPPACSSHSGENRRGKAGRTAGDGYLLPEVYEEMLEPGFYDQALSEEELADLVIYAAEQSLEDEIACTRTAVRRTLAYLQERSGSMSESEFLQATGLLFQGARTIARLLREQHALTGGEDSRLQAIIDAALDGLSEDLGIQL